MCESSVSPGGNQDFILSDGDKTFRQQTKEKAKDDTNNIGCLVRTQISLATFNPLGLGSLCLHFACKEIQI